MTAFSVVKLIAQARRSGGKLRVRDGKLQYKFVSPTGHKSSTKRTAELAQLLCAHAEAVKAILYEEAAALAYQRAGADWWKQYERGVGIDVVPDHIVRTTMPDQADIVRLTPEACFTELKAMLADYEASGAPRYPRPVRPAPVPEPRGYGSIVWPTNFADVQEQHRQACLQVGGRVILPVEDDVYMVRLWALFRRAKCATEVLQ